MNGEPPVTPAEEALRRHLAVLRSTPVPPSAALVPRTLRAARWQRPLRAALRLAGALGGAVGAGLRVLAGGRRR